jgi:hypothetical protein
MPQAAQKGKGKFAPPFEPNYLSGGVNRRIPQAYQKVGVPIRGRSGIDRVSEVLGGVSWLISWPRKKPIKL